MKNEAKEKKRKRNRWKKNERLK